MPPICCVVTCGVATLPPRSIVRRSSSGTPTVARSTSSLASGMPKCLASRMPKANRLVSRLTSGNRPIDRSSTDASWPGMSPDRLPLHHIPGRDTGSAMSAMLERVTSPRVSSPIASATQIGPSGLGRRCLGRFIESDRNGVGARRARRIEALRKREMLLRAKSSTSQRARATQKAPSGAKRHNDHTDDASARSASAAELESSPDEDPDSRRSQLSARISAMSN